MKKFIPMAAAVAMALGFATSASAECVESGSCFDSYQKLVLGGSAQFGGFGATQFIGAEGSGEVTKNGYSFTETVVNVAGDLCGVDCQSGSFTFTGAAGEEVHVGSWAKGTVPGEAVSAINEGGSFSNVTFQFGKMNITAPAQ